MQTYTCYPNREGRYLKEFQVKAMNLNNLRKNLIAEYTGKYDFIEIKTERNGFGLLDLAPYPGMNVLWNGNSYVNPKNGTIRRL